MPEKQAAISLSVDGRQYTVVVGDLTSLDAMALRRATGMSIQSLMRTATEDPDIDVIAALVWLARRTTGEKNLRFEDVASEIGYDVDIQTLDAADTEDEAPEA